MTPTSVVSLAPNPCLDKSSSIDRVAPDVKLRCDAPSYDPGGGGVNVARVLHRMEIATELIYPCGGSVGTFLESLLDRDGLNHHPVPISGMTRESFMVVETSTGQQYRFSEPGPRVSESDWNNFLDQSRERLLSGVEYAVGSGSLPPGVPTGEYGTLAGWAREGDVRFVLDAAGAFLRRGLEGRPYLIKPNLRELGQLSGRDIRRDEDTLEAARELVGDGRVDNVVVSLGAGGALLVNEEGPCWYRAPTVPIRSRVGAGDSMVGGIVYGLVAGNSIREAVRYGVAAGSAAVMTPGTELCYAGDVRDLHGRVTMRQGGPGETT